MAPISDHHPTDFEGQAERAEAERRRHAALATQRRKDLGWMLAGPRGRRQILHQLRVAGFDVRSDVVDTHFDRHHGVMSFSEGLRLPAMQTIWHLLRSVALKELDIEDLARLFATEGDDQT